MRTLLIDADSLVYAAAVPNEHAIQWDPLVYTYHGFIDPARSQIDADIEAMKQLLSADKVILALSSYEKPWRKEILPTYKANRKDIRRPVLFTALRDYCHEVYQTTEIKGLEGDDVLGILLTDGSDREPGDESICCSIDKDMKTLPGKHWNWDKDTNHVELREVTEVDANRFHMTQTLTGDSVDGYSGLPGCGPKGAEKLLAGLTTVAEMWPVIVKAYEKAGLSEEAALTQARVARICRASDYDFKTKEVVLWNPPA